MTPTMETSASLCRYVLPDVYLPLSGGALCEVVALYAVHIDPSWSVTPRSFTRRGGSSCPILRGGAKKARRARTLAEDAETHRPW